MTCMILEHDKIETSYLKPNKFAQSSSCQCVCNILNMDRSTVMELHKFGYLIVILVSDLTCICHRHMDTP